MQVIEKVSSAALSFPKRLGYVALAALLVSCAEPGSDLSDEADVEPATPEPAEVSKGDSASVNSPLGMADLSDSDASLVSETVNEFLTEAALSENGRVSRSAYEAPTLIGMALMLKGDYKTGESWDFSDLTGDDKRNQILTIAKAVIGCIRIQNENVAFEMSNALLAINEQSSDLVGHDAASVAKELKSLLEPVLTGNLPGPGEEKAFGKKLSTILVDVLEPVGGLDKVFIWDPKEKHFNTPD